MSDGNYTVDEIAKAVLFLTRTVQESNGKFYFGFDTSATEFAEFLVGRIEAKRKPKYEVGAFYKSPSGYVARRDAGGWRYLETGAFYPDRSWYGVFVKLVPETEVA